MRIYSDLKLLKVEPIALIALLSTQFRLMLQAVVLKKENKSEQEIASFLDVHPYRIKLALKNAVNYTLNDVKNILVELSTLDSKIKNGQYDRYVDFELFLASK